MNDAMKSYPYYIAMSCYCGGQLHPGSLSLSLSLSSFAVRILWFPMASARQQVLGELVNGIYTRGEPDGPRKNETGPLFLMVFFWEAKNNI